MTVPFRFLRIVTIAAVAAFVVVAWAQQHAPPAQAVLDDSDRDGAIDLAEEAAGSDPNDPTSIPETIGTEIVAGYASCTDGVDNDRDGLTDDDDPGCTDSDGDIVSDPGEEYYGSDPLDAASTPESSRIDIILQFYGLPISTCTDGIDNDLDGLTDDDDPGCTPIVNDGDDFDDLTEKRFGSDPSDPASVPEHELPNPGSCSDGVDNDLDGLIDDVDPGCGTPANDDFADAVVIAPGDIPFSTGPVITKNATSEAGEPSPCGGKAATVWYQFTPAADVVVVADTIGSDYDTALAAYTGDSLNTLMTIGCNDDSGALQSRLSFAASAGVTYHLQVGGYYGNTGNLVLNVITGTPPPNDDFPNAQLVPGLPFTDSETTTFATTQFGEPSPGCAYRLQSTVWYTFTPAEDALVVADTAGSDFSTVLGVWTESPFGLAGVACASQFSPGVESRLAFEATAGQTYFFQVGGLYYGTPSGSLTFNLDIGVPPANDDFADAAGIGSLPFSDPVDTITATTELGEPTPSCLYANVASTVWYSYTPSADTFLLADTEGSEFYGTVIGVYQGSSPAELSEVACTAGGYPATRLAFEAAGGETYFFQIGGQSYGPIVFEDEAEAELPQEDDNPGAGGFPTPGGNLVFNLDTFVVPSCPAPQFSIDDPVGDTTGFPPPPGIEAPQHDIVSVSGASDAESFCLTVELAEPIDPPDADTEGAIYAMVDIDMDRDPDTGYTSSLDYTCPRPAGLGTEVEVSMFGGSGILVPIYQYFFDGPVPPPEEGLFAISLFDENSFTLVIPLAALGGDDSFNFALYVGGRFFGRTDCAPNGGHISSPTPATLGDASCDGAVNSLDATLILQLFARISRFVPCQHAADVNGNGDAGPLDAILILQYDAGLLESLPP